jgi:hypothetical protein
MTPRAELLDYVVLHILTSFNRGSDVDDVEASVSGWCSSIAAQHSPGSRMWQVQAHLEDGKRTWSTFVRDVVRRLRAEQAVYGFAVVSYPHPVLRTKSRWRLERRTGGKRRSAPQRPVARRGAPGAQAGGKRGVRRGVGGSGGPLEGLVADINRLTGRR